MSNKDITDRVMAGIFQSIEDLVPLKTPSVFALQLLRDVATQAGRCVEALEPGTTIRERNEAFSALKRAYDLYEQQCLNIRASWGKK